MGGWEIEERYMGDTSGDEIAKMVKVEISREELQARIKDKSST